MALTLGVEELEIDALIKGVEIALGVEVPMEFGQKECSVLCASFSCPVNVFFSPDKSGPFRGCPRLAVVVCCWLCYCADDAGEESVQEPPQD